MSIYQLPSGSGISELPRDLLIDVMLLLPGQSLIKICQSNSWFRAFCDEHNVQFWQQKLQNDYPTIKITNDYKTHYFKLVSGQIKPVKVEIGLIGSRDKIIGTILISNDDSLENVLDKVVTIIKDYILNKYGSLGSFMIINMGFQNNHYNTLNVSRFGFNLDEIPNYNNVSIDTWGINLSDPIGKQNLNFDKISVFVDYNKNE